MKLDLTKHQFLVLLQESASFREIIYDQMQSLKINTSPLFYYKTEIKQRFKPNEKIPAIKWLRQEVSNKNHLDVFKDAGYTCDDFVLNLAGAKKFVDEIF